MIETILLVTGALVWIAIGVTIALCLPLVPAFAIAWVSYKTGRTTIRDKSLNFAIWWIDHTLKPIFDPLMG